LPTDISDGVHHQKVDMIIEPLFRKLSQTSRSTPGGRQRRDTAVIAVATQQMPKLSLLSASLDRLPKNVRVLAIVIAELELREIEQAGIFLLTVF
jgi:hypothetical protein